MATDPRKLASNDKHLQKLDRITFRLYKDGRDGLTKEQIEQVAQDENQSAAAYIVATIKARIEGGTVQPVPQITPQKAQDEPQAVEGISITGKPLEAAQRAAEARGKPVPDWIANAIEAQAKEDERKLKLKERQKKESSDQ